MSNAVAEDFAYYDDYNTYKNEISKVWNGIRYLRDFAADDYENAFVKLVLNWWEDAIWNKDSCSETLLNARASDLRTAISKEDLKHMYLRQIEFLFVLSFQMFLGGQPVQTGKMGFHYIERGIVLAFKKNVFFSLPCC